MNKPLVDAAIARQNINGSNFEMTYGGVLSFMRRNYTKNLDNVDIAVSGIPLDIATTYRSGARLGPRAIRQASVQLSELLPYPWGVDPFDKLSVIDFGDCFLSPHEPNTIHQAIVNHINNFLIKNVFPITLGGDHYITYPILEAMTAKYGKNISLIHFDAHCDTWQDDNDYSLNHGTMFYKAIKHNLINPKYSIQIGNRTFNESFMNMNVIGADYVHDNSWKMVVEKINDIVVDKPVYMTFDIDSLDPAYAPGTGTPVAGGLTTHQALSIIRNLNNINLIGFDLVEVAPAYDHAEITAIAAAHIICDVISLLASKK